jgi:hypothetical protein
MSRVSTQSKQPVPAAKADAVQTAKSRLTFDFEGLNSGYVVRACLISSCQVTKAKQTVLHWKALRRQARLRSQQQCCG